MSTLLLIVAAVVLIVVVINLTSDRKTKLFRRIWSTERMGGGYADNKQRAAVNELISTYGIKSVEDVEQMRKSVTGLLADAAIFDQKNPRNMGVYVAPVLARELRTRFPNIANS